MLVGCFSWCRPLKPWKPKITETKSEVSNQFRLCNFSTTNCVQKLPENEVAIVTETKENTSVEDRVIETNSKAVRGLILHPANSLTHIWIQKSSETPEEVVPTTIKYITATGKQALTLLQSAAALIPVPMIQEAIGVALKIIELCEVRKIPPRIGCEMVYDFWMLEYVCRHAKGQKSAR